MNPNTNPGTSDAAEIMDLEFGDDPAYGELRARERVKSQATQAISDARRSAGLTVWSLPQAPKLQD